jgi:peptidoglycan LD-endopeptidase LytH
MMMTGCVRRAVPAQLSRLIREKRRAASRSRTGAERRRWRIAPAFLIFAVLALAARAADRFELVWPTPNRAWADGRPAAEYLQHAGSGDPESGGFGGVRSGGAQFHEGIDIKCVARDRRGEPLDNVFAAMAGVVRHVSASAGDSNYGRYLVIEHVDLAPAVYTLYAHLARIAPGLTEGTRVSAGQILGTMGHSSSRAIPKERAHLHFEMGLMVTRNFQRWYDRRKFGSANDHGLWNGMNLMGLDPLAFFNAWRAGRLASPLDFFQQQTTAVRLRIATLQTPDFVARYPSLLTKPLPLLPPTGWEIRFNWTGVPFSWTPLAPSDVVGLLAGHPQIIEVNAELLRREKSKSIALSRRGTWTPGKDLETVLEQLFGR